MLNIDPGYNECSMNLCELFWSLLLMLEIRALIWLALMVFGRRCSPFSLVTLLITQSSVWLPAQSTVLVLNIKHLQRIFKTQYQQRPEVKCGPRRFWMKVEIKQMAMLMPSTHTVCPLMLPEQYTSHFGMVFLSAISIDPLPPMFYINFIKASSNILSLGANVS